MKALLLAPAVALAFTGWSGWHLWDTWHGGSSASVRHDRDAALRAGRAEIATLNTMDATDDGRIDAGLRAWLATATGPLHDQLQASTAKNKDQLKKAGTTAVGTVLSAAVTSLDERAGQAEVIASVRVRLTPPGGGAPSDQSKRYEANLERTGAGWKLTSITSLPVDAA